MRRCKWPQISLNFQVFVTLRACTPIAETTMACLKIKYQSLSDYHLAKLMVLCFKEVYDTDPNCIIYTCPSTLSYVSSFSPLWVYTFPPPVLRVYLLFLFFVGFEPFARRGPIHSIVFLSEWDKRWFYEPGPIHSTAYQSARIFDYNIQFAIIESLVIRFFGFFGLRVCGGKYVDRGIFIILLVEWWR